MPSRVNEPAEETPLSRIVGAADIGDADEAYDIDATAAECAAIARQFKIPRIGSLSGRFLLQPDRQGRILATLHLTARVTRTCVVSLEEFETRIDEETPLVFIPADQIAPFDDDPESPDEIPFDGIAIDLGVALTEQLALSLDPYPRKPDVILPEVLSPARENPFALFFKEAMAARGEPED